MSRHMSKEQELEELIATLQSRVRTAQAALRALRTKNRGWGEGDTVRLYRKPVREIYMRSTRPSAPRLRPEYETVRISGVEFGKEVLHSITGQRRKRDGTWTRTTRFYDWDWDFARTEKVDG